MENPRDQEGRLEPGASEPNNQNPCSVLIFWPYTVRLIKVFLDMYNFAVSVIYDILECNEYIFLL